MNSTPATLTPLDEACQAHMAHPAGSAFDGLHDACADAACMRTQQSGTPAPAVGMWDAECAHPWRYAGLYAAALLAGLLGSHALAWVQVLLGMAGTR